MARRVIIAVTAALLGVLAAVLYYSRPSRRPSPPTRPASQPVAAPFVLALVPEYDVFALRRNYRALAEYLSPRIGRKIEIATLNHYEAVLGEFAEKRIDAAVLGSLVATIAMDRNGARPLVRPVSRGASTYHGVLFAREDSPIRQVEQLGGGRIAMVKTTYAAALFPLAEMRRASCQPRQLDDPRLLWVGTHDDVIEAVMTGAADIGAVKNLRLEAFLRGHGDSRLRILAKSPDVPNGVVLVSPAVSSDLVETLRVAMLGMAGDPQARATLSGLGIEGYIATTADEFSAVYDMIDAVGEGWALLGVAGPPPRRPAGKGN